MTTEYKDCLLMLADNSLILGQRLGELCGHGPILEQDIALTNVALDLIGEARYYYQILAAVEVCNEDDYVMLRDVREFKNVLLVEQPNGHWGDTIMRQFLFDCYHFYLLKGLESSTEKALADIASKCVKEATYHLAFSSEWVIRMGDGTEESHQKIQYSLDNLYPLFGEFFVQTLSEKKCIELGILPDLETIKSQCIMKIDDTINKASLREVNHNGFVRHGGKNGLHSEHLGYILTELQYLQRTHPGAEW